MIEFKFNGTVSDLRTFLSGLPEGMFVSCNSGHATEESTEDRAWRLAKPFIINGWNKIQAIKQVREVTRMGPH